jgi:phosphatidylglycerol:prolipoprotein diacylglycerol transferase
MLPIVNLGPLALPLPGLLLIGGVWLATLTIDREAGRRSLSANTLNNLVFIGLIGGILGARLGYVLRHIDAYVNVLPDIFSLNTSTMSLGDGLLAGSIAALIYAQRRDLPLWPTLDAFTPGLALFSIFVGFSHLASGDAYGAPTSLPWALRLWGAERHPSQVYEIAAALLLFWIVSRLKLVAPFPGFLFLTFIAASAAGRVFLEAFRGDSEIVFGGVRSVQLLGLTVLLLGLFGLHLLAKDARTMKAES